MRHSPSGSLRQTMRKRRRVVGAPEPLGPLTQVARPVVAAKSPAPIVDSATISIEEIAICGAAASVELDGSGALSNVTIGITDSLM